MDDPFRMRRIECVSQLNRDIEQAIGRKWPGLQPLGQVLPLEQLHRNERLILPVLSRRAFHRVNRADVRVVQRRGRSGLQQKSIERILIARQLRRKKFQRDFAAKREVLGLIDHSHPATAQWAKDAIVRDGLVHHA